MLLFFVRHLKRRLYVIALAGLIHHKVYFQMDSLLLAVWSPLTYFDLPDVHLISPYAKLIVDNVFHNVVLFLLTEIDECIADARVFEIVLRQSADVFTPLDVISLGPVDDKGLLQISEVVVYSLARYI